MCNKLRRRAAGLKINCWTIIAVLQTISAVYANNQLSHLTAMSLPDRGMTIPRGVTISMQMTGEQLISLPREQVWQALNDATILKACIPGCEAIERIGSEEYRIVMAVALGPVRARFTARLLYTSMTIPEACTMAFEGNGGPAGFGKGEASVTLESKGAATLLRYAAKASVGGRLAQLGGRLIDAASEKMAADFFSTFKQILSGRFTASAAVEEPIAELASESATNRGSTRLLLYVGILVLIGCVVYFLLT